MRASLRKIGIAAATAVAITGMTAAHPNVANARHGHGGGGHWRGGGGGFGWGFGTGLALGALPITAGTTDPTPTTMAAPTRMLAIAS